MQNTGRRFGTFYTISKKNNKRNDHMHIHMLSRGRQDPTVSFYVTFANHIPLRQTYKPLPVPLPPTPPLPASQTYKTLWGLTNINTLLLFLA